MLRGVLHIAIAGFAFASCQLFVSSDDEQCATDAQCTARGGPFANSVCVDRLCVPPGDRCVGHVEEAVEDRTAIRHQRLRIVDIAGTPARGVPVLVCANLDELCESPAGAPVVTDDAGYAYVSLWKNFKGTVQVKEPPLPDQFKLKLYFIGALDTDDRPDREVPIDSSLRLFSRTLFRLQLEARATLDETAGHVLGATYDCDLRPRPGTRVAIESARPGGPIVFYLSDSLTLDQTLTQTASLGTFGVANAPEGPMVLSASTPAGRRLGRVEVWINRDTIANFSIVPTPDP